MQNYDDYNWADFIFDEVDLVDYIQRYEDLRHAGNGEWVGSHDVSHDSTNKQCLFVNEHKNIFHCFHCGLGGNVIHYEMDRAGSDFVTACRHIANVCNLTLPDSSNDNLSEEEREVRDARRNKNERVANILNKAAEYYHNNLHINGAREYYRSRGMTDETIDDLKLGYATDDRHGLFRAMQRWENDKDILMSTGLFFINERGVVCDSFYSRYMIPYWLNTSQVCYFNGRDALNSDKRPRYKKQAQTHAKNESGDGKEYPVNQDVVRHVIWGANEIPRKPRRRRPRESDEERVLVPMDPKPIRIRVLVCEGVVDAILARQELGDTYSVISPTTTRFTDESIRAIADVITRIGKCYVVFCNDNDSNNAGAEGALATAEKLNHQANKMHEATAVNLLAEEAENTSHWIHQLADTPEDIIKTYVSMQMPRIHIATLPRAPEIESVDIADYIAAGKADEVRYWVREDTSRSIWHYNAYLENNPMRFFDGKGHTNFVPKYMSDELRSEGGNFYISLGRRLYNYDSGYYSRDPDEERVRHSVLQKLSVKRQPRIINTAVDDLLTDVFKSTDILDKGEDDLMLVNCLNGLFDVENDSLESHTPDHISLYQIQANWNPNAKCPKIEQFLAEMLDEESQQAFWEMLGYCLLPDNRFHQSFIMIGEGNSGKSTALRIVERFLGDDNTAAVSLHEIEDNPYSPALIYGKLANICSDISSKHLSKTDKFKNISAGDAIMIEEKYKTAFPAVLNAKLLFSANTMPTTSDRTSAFIRRWVPIMFERKLTENEVIPDFIDQIATQDEIDGVFVHAVRGLEAALERRKVLIPNKSRTFLEDYQEENDVVIEFANDCVTETTESIANSELFALFRQFCDNVNRQAVGKIKFLRRFRELYPDKETTLSGNKKGFEGISVSTENSHSDAYGDRPGYNSSEDQTNAADISDGPGF